MKKILLFSAVAMAANNLQAQCAFNPTISGDTMLCPNSAGTLFTQSNYDSVQWYSRPYGSNPGSETAIPGATTVSHFINDTNDLLYYFSVDASQGGCTERSPEVLVDGWMFLLPVVATTGEFTVGSQGETVICEGDTAYFELMSPYDTNIVWTRDGNAIPGATSPLLAITEAGDYTVSGAPSLCPNFIQQLGVILTVQVITCPTGIEKTETPMPSVKAFPNPATDRITFVWEALLQGQSLQVYNALGQLVWEQANCRDAQVEIVVNDWETGVYYLQAGTQRLVWIKQ